jgi:hypothetical protein
MKVIVWANKDEVVKNNIQNVFTHCPQPGYGNYIQVSMSIDEYVKIQDNTVKIDNTLTSPQSGPYYEKIKSL